MHGSIRRRWARSTSHVPGQKPARGTACHSSCLSQERGIPKRISSGITSTRSERRTSSTSFPIDHRGVRALVHVRTEHDHRLVPFASWLKWTAGGHGLLGALPRSFQVTPEIPTGDERQNKPSQANRPTASKRVSSPPVGTISTASDITDTPNPNSKPRCDSDLLGTGARTRRRRAYARDAAGPATRRACLSSAASACSVPSDATASTRVQSGWEAIGGDSAVLLRTEANPAVHRCCGAGGAAASGVRAG